MVVERIVYRVIISAKFCDGKVNCSLRQDYFIAEFLRHIELPTGFEFRSVSLPRLELHKDYSDEMQAQWEHRNLVSQLRRESDNRQPRSFVWSCQLIRKG